MRIDSSKKVPKIIEMTALNGEREGEMGLTMKHKQAITAESSAEYKRGSKKSKEQFSMSPSAAGETITLEALHSSVGDDLLK